jgi:hypothetical protein
MNATAAHRTLDGAALEEMVSAASAAPSIHNTQPWRYRLRAESATLEVRAATERALRVVDPAGRALHISIGAALFNLRLAAQHLGLDACVRLLPDPEDPQLLAEARLRVNPRSRTDAGAALYEAIWHRHSSRLPFTDQAVAPHILTELGEAAHIEGGRLRIADAAETRRVLGLTWEAEQRSRADVRRSQESRDWLLRASTSPYGIAPAAMGPQDAFERVPMRDFTAQRHVEHLPAAPFESHPLIAVLSTAHDRRVDWLRTGQALQRVLLLATAHQLRSSLLHQAMEWPDLRWSLRDPQHGEAYVQLLIRLGFGPEGAPSARQAAAALLDQDSAPPRP